jgi:hypothetical protein
MPVMKYTMPKAVAPSPNSQLQISGVSSMNFDQKAEELVHAFEKGVREAKNVYNWIKKYICPRMSGQGLMSLASQVEKILQSNSSTTMKIAHIAESLAKMCIL